MSDQEESETQDTELETTDAEAEDLETGHRKLGGRDTKPDAGGKQISSRGVPSSESIYLPRHDSDELRSFQDKNESITRNPWNAEELTNFIFSKRYQPKYYEIALGFIKLLCDKTVISGDETSAFVRTNSISKATFYNRVLPRLKRVGMIKVERDTLVSIETKRKFRPMRISLSKTFGNYFMKIGDSWLAIVDDSRSKNEKKDQMRL